MIIPAGGYKIIWADQNTIQGPLHLNFTLNASGGFLGLFGSDGETFVDGVEYPTLDSSRNYGRFPDGSAWQDIFYPTPDASNSDSIPPTIIDTTSVFTIEYAQQFSVYPNPATNNISIVKLGEAINSKPSFTLTDLSGREFQVVEQEIKNGKFWKLTIDKFPTGLYFLKIADKGNTAYIKVLKTN